MSRTDPLIPQPPVPAEASEERPSHTSSRRAIELTEDLAREIGDLIHSEIQLAKVEVTQKGRRLGLAAGGLGAGSVLGLLGLGCLVATAVVAVHAAIALWLALLAVGLGCLLAGGLAALVARAQVKRASPPLPSEAIDSTKEDIRWLKTHAKSENR